MSVLENSLAPPTRFDWNFRIGDIPVRVHPFFWLSTIFLGLDLNLRGSAILIHLGIWAAVLLVSILVHEMGHVLMGRYFGNPGHILLTGFCGLAIGSGDLPRRWQRNLVSLAGPGAGFVFAALIAGGFALYNGPVTLYLLGRLFRIMILPGPEVDVPGPYVLVAVYTLLWVNIFWGLVNLLPIWPLDGGQVSREACEHFQGRDGIRTSLVISIGTALAFVAYALLEFAMKRPPLPFLSLGSPLFPVLFFGLLALTSWQLLQHVRRAGPDWDREDQEPRDPWEQDADWWKRGDNPWRD